MYLQENFMFERISKMKIAQDFQQGDCFRERKMKSNKMQFGYVSENE